MCFDVIVLLLAWITSSKRTPDAICCAIYTVLHQAVAGLNEEELLEGCFLFCSGSLVLVLYQAPSFARSFTLAHCIFPSLGNDKGKWGSRPPYAPPRFKLTSALIARHDCTVVQEITFFIGWLVTLLWLLMSKKPRSASSRFNLTEWGVREYVITAAQAPLFAATVLRSFEPHGFLAFDLSTGRTLIIMLQ